MRAIEKDFPFEALNDVAELESWRKEVYRPIYHMHKWWATRLGSVFRAIILGAITKEPEKVWERFYSGYDAKGKIVLDPFMGSGTTIGEALKLGCAAVGCDINPVSYFIVRKALRNYSQKDIHKAFQNLEDRVKSNIQHFYKSKDRLSGREVDILYSFWVMEVACPDCSKEIPLFNSYVFASNAYPSRKPEQQVVCPDCRQIILSDYRTEQIKCPSCLKLFNPDEGPARGSMFHCDRCNEFHSIIDAVRTKSRKPDYRLYALMLLVDGEKRVYAKPEDFDLRLYEEASAKLRRGKILIPEEEILPGHNTNQARNYNYLKWKDLFNDRQLLSLGTLMRGILDEPDEEIRELFLLLFSGTLEFNNMFCSFKGEGTGAVRHSFYHHILKPERAPLENTVWGTPKSSGTFSTLYKSRILKAIEYQEAPFELLAEKADGRLRSKKVFLNKPIKTTFATTFDGIKKKKANLLLLQGNSANLRIPNKSIDAVVTDPPYFDFVHYSELADFFYVWMRLGLKDKFGEFQSQTSRSEGEVQSKENHVFQKNFTSVLKECKRVLKRDGVLAFTFHHSRQEGWESVISAIHDSGFSVTAAHPIKAEMAVATPKNQAKEPIDIDSVIVCRNASKSTEITWEEFIREVEEKALICSERFNKTGKKLSKGDMRVILMSAFLVTYSKHYNKIVGKENLPISLKEAMIGVDRLVDELSDNQVVTKRVIEPEKKQLALF